MILKLFRLIPIYKKIIISTFCISFVLFLSPALAVHTGKLEYNDVLFDYSKLDSKQIISEADSLFKEYESAQDSKVKTKYSIEAMGKYYLLTKIEPGDSYPYVQLARLYIDIDKRKFARANLSTALNIEHNNPFTNYYYGEYYYKYRDFRRALKHYLIAYNNGYNGLYDLNLKMAIIYEKFGDLAGAIEFYKKASAINNSNSDLRIKIQSLSGLEYNKSEYYQSEIRE